MCLLTNVHSPPREDSYCNELGNVIKPPIVADNNCLMGHVGNSDRMASSYIAICRNMEVDKKNSFPPFGPSHCQQLHPFIFMWWKEILTHRFLTHPHQRDAGMGWA